MKNQPQAVREAIVANLAGITPETAGAVAALYQLSVMFAYGLPDAQGRNPLWAGMEYPGPVQAPPATPKTLQVLTPSGEESLDADVVVVGSGCGGGVAAAVLAQAGKRVIILESGGYSNESDFVQSELLAYQKLFLRGGFFPSADGMVSIAAGGTVGGGSTVNWSNSLLTPAIRPQPAGPKPVLTDVDTPAFDEHLQAVFDRISCNDKVATQNSPAPADGRQARPNSATRIGWPTSTSTRRSTTPPDRLQRHGRSDAAPSRARCAPTCRTPPTPARNSCPTPTPIGFSPRTARPSGSRRPTPTRRRRRVSRVVIHAPSVVVAAGSLETPALLLRSGIGGPAVGAELRLHPASLITGIYHEPQDPWFGPAMAGVMNEFAEANDGFGYLIECVQHLPGLFTTVVPWLSGAQHKELTRKYRYRADWVFLVKDRGAGSVTLDENGQAMHWYPFTTSSTGATSAKAG